MNKKQDRRILRTRKMLSNALLELLEDKEYSQISVKEITDHANIGRSTFYEHFEDKDQLLFSGHEDLKLLIETCSKSSSGLETKILIKRLFEHIEEYRSISMKMKGKEHGELMLDRMRLIMEDHFKQEAQKEVIRDEISNLFSVSFGHAFIGFVTFWIQKKQNVLSIEYAVHKTEELFRSFVSIAKMKKHRIE